MKEMESQTKTSLKLQAYQYLKTKILNCEYRPNEFLNEQKLCAEMGNISRTPMRDALGRLEQEGLITILPKKGLMVSGITEEDVHSMFEMRLLVEPYALRTYGSGIPREQLETFAELMHHPDSITDFCESDDEFHELLMSTLPNKYLRSAYDRITGLNTRFRIMTGKVRLLLRHRVPHTAHKPGVHGKPQFPAKRPRECLGLIVSAPPLFPPVHGHRNDHFDLIFKNPVLIKRCRLPRIIRRIFAPVCIFKPVHGLPDISLIHKHGFPLAVRMPALSAVQTEFRPLAIQRLAASLAHRFLGKPYSIRAPSARDTFRHRHAVADRTSRRIDETNDRLRHPPQSASCFFFSCCKISLHCISRSPPVI